MRSVGGKLLLILALGLVLSACSRGEPRLLNIRAQGQGPDEFGIVPNKPLQQPESFATLPPPTPGGVNRVDPTPHADASVALGGRQQVARGIPASDAGLISHAGRYGTTPNIRQTLATEDLEFRRRNDGRLLEQLFNVNVYFRAYRNLALDQYAELERFRRIGVRTPAAPPEPQ